MFFVIFSNCTAILLLSVLLEKDAADIDNDLNSEPPPQPPWAGILKSLSSHRRFASRDRMWLQNLYQSKTKQTSSFAFLEMFYSVIKINN